MQKTSTKQLNEKIPNHKHKIKKLIEAEIQRKRTYKTTLLWEILLESKKRDTLT